MNIHYSLSTFCILMSFHAWITPYAGILDTTFNHTGIVQTHFQGEPLVNGVTTQADDKIIIVGSMDNKALVMRYTTDGSLDKTFGGSGILVHAVQHYNSALVVAVQPDGKIITAGYSDMSLGITRYNTDGSLDTTFNGTGMVLDDFSPEPLIIPQAIALQDDGKIVLVGSTMREGSTDYAVLRYTIDGSLDTTFNPQGSKPGVVIVTHDGLRAAPHALAIQADGKLVVSGQVDYQLTLVRYMADGSLDTTFNETGIVKSNVQVQNSSVQIQKNGKIIVSVTVFDVPTPESTSEQVALVRYTSNGSLDKTFNKTGVVVIPLTQNPVMSSLLLQSNGKPVITGSFVDKPHYHFIIRYNKNGVLDTTFNPSGCQPGMVVASLDNAVSKSATLDNKDNIILVGQANMTDKPSDFIITVRYTGV